MERHAAAKKTPPRPDPPLGVAHLLIWTAGCAVYFAVMRALLPVERIDDEVGVLILDGFAKGAGLAGIGLLIGRRFRGMTFPRYAGEWLLVAVGARFLLESAAIALNLRASPALYAAINCCVLIPPALLLKASHIWRAVFCAMVIAYAILPLTNMLAVLAGINIPDTWHEGYVIRVREVIVVTMVAIVLVIEIRSKKRAPWTHWVGLFTWYFNSAWDLMFFLFLTFLSISLT